MSRREMWRDPGKRTWRRIVQLGGTSGAGKSTVAFALMKRFPTVPVDPDERGRPRGYRVTLPSGRALLIVGRYETQCGGCDAIGSWAEVARRVDRYQQQGHVLFEGLLVGNGYGSLGEHLEQYGTRVQYCFLDTPLALCLQRVNARRAKRGVTEPVNPKNTEQKFKASRATYARLRDELQRPVHWLPYRRAVSALLAVLGERA